MLLPDRQWSPQLFCLLGRGMCPCSTYHHDLLVAGYSSHNVFCNGSGTDLCLDHHGAAPHNHLWTDIDLVSP